MTCNYPPREEDGHRGSGKPARGRPHAGRVLRMASPDGGRAAAQPGVKAEVVLSRIASGQLGIAPAGPDRLLVTTEDAVIRVDLRDRTADVAVAMTRCRRNPLISQDGSILFLRANGIGCYRDGRFTTVGGALTGNCCLLANPDGSTWVFDNGADADPGASATKLGSPP